MLLFRSEEHVERWCASRGVSRGETFTPAQMWSVAREWFADRLSPDWRRRTVDEAEAIFARAVLRSGFWALR